MPQHGDIQVGLVGITGYAGQVLHALLTQHPCMDPVVIEARTPADLRGAEAADLAELDAVCLALPGEASAVWTEHLLGLVMSRGKAPRVLDLSDHHRRDEGVHYGQPELFGPPPPDAKLVANPGCYPTATLLALRPLLDAGVIEGSGIAVVGASGASGAGKGVAEHLHFCALESNLFPYKVGSHRHIPEIEKHLGAPISFVTELLPVVRGILVTAFVRPTASPEVVHETLRSAHVDHPYVTVLDEPGQACGLRQVVGTHQAVLAVGPTERSGLLPVFATIDNLMKGAASQAVHNLNLWLGLEPHLGLPAPADVRQGPPRMIP